MAEFFLQTVRQIKHGCKYKPLISATRCSRGTAHLPWPGRGLRLVREEITVAERAEGLAKIERAAGTFDLIPRIPGIDGGRGGIRGGVALLFAMVAGGVFKTFLGASDGIDQRDQGRDGDEQDSNEN